MRACPGVFRGVGGRGPVGNGRGRRGRGCDSDAAGGRGAVSSDRVDRNHHVRDGRADGRRNAGNRDVDESSGESRVDARKRASRRDVRSAGMSLPSGLKSSVVNTATTIVCPATTNVIWRVNVGYKLVV